MNKILRYTVIVAITTVAFIIGYATFYTFLNMSNGAYILKGVIITGVTASTLTLIINEAIKKK